MSCIYTQDLAMRYFPDSTPTRARRLFTKMIYNNPNLLLELQSEGWKTNMRFLTPKQFEIVVKYIGFP